MSWTRRIFVKEAIAGWLGLVLAPAGYAIIRRWPEREKQGLVETIRLGSVDDFGFGSSRSVAVGDLKVIVGRSGDGTFHAVSGVCTHLGCSIRFQPANGQPEFACNCHDSRFDLDGINLSGPATLPLERFVVEVQGKDLILKRIADSDGL